MNDSVTKIEEIHIIGVYHVCFVDSMSQDENHTDDECDKESKQWSLITHLL